MGIKISYMNAIRDGIAEEMRRDPRIIILGEGIGERGGSYGHTKNLWQEFGKERVIDVPISENGWVGMGVGAAVSGLRPILDLMFADILFEIMSPLAHQAGKLCYMSNGQFSVPLVIRSQMGARTTGPHHSGAYYPILMHIPGIKIAVPSDAYTAKGLIKTAIRDDNPVLFCEDKFFFNKKMEIPEGEYTISFGQASIVREGQELTIIAIGTMLHKVLETLDSGNISVEAEVIDPRTLLPLDMETIISSVQKTGRILIVEEAHLTCNAGAEIIAQICTQNPCILKKADRVSTLDIPHPFSPILEREMVPGTERIRKSIVNLMKD
ncbi:MAG: transketolase C-terminal domain-containing protein [Spirochaetota bacterium]